MLSFVQLVLFCAAALWFYCLRHYKVSTGVDHKEHRIHLKSLPSSIKNIIPILLNQLFFKYGYKSYLFNTEWGKEKIFPNLLTTIGPLSIDLNHLNEYCKCVAIDINNSNPIPFGYFHCLSVQSLLFTLCKRRKFPLKLLGAVHFENKFVIHKYVFDKHCELFIETSVNQRVLFTKKRDLTFSVLHKVFVNKTDLLCEITDVYLVRAPKKYRIKNDGSEKKDVFDIEDRGDIIENEYQWKEIASDVSRKYSMICGDINPIHLHTYLAKPFGFCSNISHGMWSVGRIIDHLLDDSQELRSDGTITIATTFERPLFLPNTPRLHTIKDIEGNQARFKLFDDASKLVLQGWLKRTST